MNATKLIAGVVATGALTVGVLGLGAGTANAAPVSGPLPSRWGPPPPPPPWRDGPGPGPVGWAPPPGAGPIPGGWANGWQPPGGFCVFEFCI